MPEINVFFRTGWFFRNNSVYALYGINNSVAGCNKIFIPIPYLKLHIQGGREKTPPIKNAAIHPF